MKTKLLIFALATAAIFSSCKKDTIKAKSCIDCKFKVLMNTDSDGKLDTLEVSEQFINTIFIGYKPKNTCIFLDTTTNEAIINSYISRNCE